jgi:hypothetical protein
MGLKEGDPLFWNYGFLYTNKLSHIRKTLQSMKPIIPSQKMVVKVQNSLPLLLN